MMPCLVKVFAIVALLFPFASVAECVAGSCGKQEDELSLMQVKNIVKHGAERSPVEEASLEVSDEIEEKTTGELTSQVQAQVKHLLVSMKKSNISSSDFDDYLSKSQLFFKEPLTKTQEAEYCWRDSHPNGVGIIPQGCDKDHELGFMGSVIPVCYKKCPASNSAGQGSKRLAGGCISKCKDGWSDDGLFCRQSGEKNSYGRGLGYAVAPPFRTFKGAMDSCEKKNPQGCTRCLLMVYPNCKKGFKPFGCNICVPDHGLNKASCKKEYGRNSYYFPPSSCAKSYEGEALDMTYSACKAPKSKFDAGLCYTPCPKGSHGIGPVCWFGAPPGWVECGMGAAKTKAICVRITTDQVFKTLAMVAKLATLGAAHVATESAHEALESAEKLIETAEPIALAVTAAYQAATSEDVAEAAAAASQGAEVLLTGTEMIEGFTGLANAETPEDAIRSAAKIVNKFDPSGVTGVIGAYTYRKCGDREGFARPGTVAAPLPAEGHRTYLQRAHDATMKAVGR